METTQIDTTYYLKMLCLVSPSKQTRENNSNDSAHTPSLVSFTRNHVLSTPFTDAWHEVGLFLPRVLQIQFRRAVASLPWCEPVE